MKVRAVIGELIREARGAALDLVAPPRCLGCCAELERGGGAMLCEACRRQLALIDWAVCPRCAAAVPDILTIEPSCGHCRGAKLKIDRTVALGSYDGLLADLVKRMKGDRTGMTARGLARLVWEELGPVLRSLEGTLVTCVPASWRRRWQLGVHPPRELAEGLARRLEIRAACGMLALRRNIPPQIGLTRAGRLRNVAGEMRLRRGYHLKDAHVLVVDDILTTGATVGEAARVLKGGGAARVTAIVLGRTPSEQ